MNKNSELKKLIIEFLNKNCDEEDIITGTKYMRYGHAKQVIGRYLHADTFKQIKILNELIEDGDVIKINRFMLKIEKKSED